jgi:hypothetical protein
VVATTGAGSSSSRSPVGRAANRCVVTGSLPASSVVSASDSGSLAWLIAAPHCRQKLVPGVSSALQVRHLGFIAVHQETIGSNPAANLLSRQAILWYTGTQRKAYQSR